MDEKDQYRLSRVLVCLVGVVWCCVHLGCVVLCGGLVSFELMDVAEELAVLDERGGGVELCGLLAQRCQLGRQGIPRMGNVEKPCIRRSAHALAIGKVALAALDEEALAGHLDELGLSAFTDGTIVDPARLRAELAEVRACGVAVDRGEYDADFGSVAATVSGVDGRPAAALAVTMTRGQFVSERRVIGRELAQAAGAIARQLSSGGVTDAASL